MNKPTCDVFILDQVSMEIKIQIGNDDDSLENAHHFANSFRSGRALTSMHNGDELVKCVKCTRTQRIESKRLLGHQPAEQQ